MLSVGRELAETPSTATPARIRLIKSVPPLKVAFLCVKNFVCKRCLGEIPSVSESEKFCLIDDDLELLSKFCYLGDTLDSNACAESSVIYAAYNVAGRNFTKSSLS